MLERVKLIEQRLARPEKIAFEFAIDLENKGGFRFVVGVIGSEKIREQLAILVNRVDRLAEKAGLATQLPHRSAIGWAQATDRVSAFGFHPAGE